MIQKIYNREYNPRAVAKRYDDLFVDPVMRLFNEIDDEEAHVCKCKEKKARALDLDTSENMTEFLRVLSDALNECTYEVPGIRKIFFNGDHTTILWEDNSKTTVGCMEGEKFDEYAGFAAAVLKKMFGSSITAKKFLDSHKVVQVPAEKKVKNNA